LFATLLCLSFVFLFSLQPQERFPIIFMRFFLTIKVYS